MVVFGKILGVFIAMLLFGVCIASIVSLVRVIVRVARRRKIEKANETKNTINDEKGGVD